MNVLHLTIEDTNGGRETFTVHRHVGYTKRDLGEEILERDLLPFTAELVQEHSWSCEDVNDLTPDEIGFVLDIDDVATFVNDQFNAMLRMDEFPESCNRNIEKALRRLAETVGLTFHVWE